MQAASLFHAPPVPQAQNVWARCLDTVAGEVSSQAFKTWFAPLRPVSFSGGEGSGEVELLVELPSQFYHEWVAQHYGPLLDRSLSSALGRPGHITFSINEARATEQREEAPALRAASPAPLNTSGRPGTAAPRPPVPSSARVQTDRAAAALPNGPLNPSYTFDRFIEGDCNRLARSAALAIAERPGATSFNPFFVYGGVGLGKTHLAQAIANQVQATGAVEQMRYVSSEQFTTEFVQAIQSNRIADFTNYYRQMDLLIVDDIQFFGGKEKTQEEFFHIFNDLHQRGKQVVLCADRPPRDIKGIEERLLSRFQWGLSADVQMPDLETRMAILRHKADAENVDVPDSVITYVAERVTSNVRELEGSLIRLLAHARLQQRRITPEMAIDALRGLMRLEPTRLDAGAIQKLVASYYGIDLAKLLGKSRKREIVQARHVAIYLCKEHTAHTLKAIGDFFGGRDHSTVIHAVTTTQDRLDIEPAFRADVEAVVRKLRTAA